MSQNVTASVEETNVQGWLTTLNGYALDASADADDLAAKLASFNGKNFSPTVDFSHYIPSVTLSHVGDVPDVPDFDLVVRTPPSALAITIPSVTGGTAPIFNDNPPTLVLPPAPTPFVGSAPVKSFTLNLDKTFPTAPSDTLPSVPTLISLNLPSPLSISTPIFDITLPDSAAIVVPGNTFSFTESVYDSNLLSCLQTELKDRLTRSTGLNPNVEQAIFDRGRDREQSLSLQAERSLLVERSQQGFIRPSGSVQSALDQITQETQSKVIDLSREIMIKQAELEQENFKFSIQQAVSLEDILIRQHENIQQRSFEVAKLVQEISVELFKVQVSKYNTEVDAYKAAASVFEITVRAELSKVEVFKAQIDAEKLKGDINEQNIRIYSEQIRAIVSATDIYKTRVEAVSEELRAENLKIESFKSEIEAYTALVLSKAEEFKGYSEQIKGELAKTEIYDSQVKAYATRVQAYATETDVTIKTSELQISGEELKIKKYLADIESYIKTVQADQLTYQSAVDIYKAELQRYLADIGLSTSVADLDLKIAETTIDQNKFDVSSSLESIKIRANIINSENQNRLQGMQSAGTVYAQLAASSLNAINVSASVTGRATVGLSESYNHNITGV